MTGRAGSPADGAGEHDGARVDDGAGADASTDDAERAPLVIKRRGRRVSTEPAPGYLGEPPREQHQSTENDARLRGDVPPHWG